MIDHIKPAQSRFNEDKTEKISITDQKILKETDKNIIKVILFKLSLLNLSFLMMK